METPASQPASASAVPAASSSLPLSRIARPIVLKQLGPSGQPEPERKAKRRHPALLFRDALLAVFIPLLLIVAFGLLQSIRPARVSSGENPADYGLDFVDVALRTSDGLKLAAWYVPSKSEDSKSAIVVLHGYPASKADLLGRAQFLAEKHALLFVDLRYFGGSDGSYTAVGLKESADAAAAVKYLQERGVDRIGIYGFSLGGAVALMAAANVPGVSAVVAEAPYATLRMMAEEPYRYLGPLKGPLAAITVRLASALIGVDADEVSPLRAVESSSLPSLLIHSRVDETVPFKNAELLWSAMSGNPNASSLFFDDLPHGAASEAFAVTVDAFFATHLNPVLP